MATPVPERGTPPTAPAAAKPRRPGGGNRLRELDGLRALMFIVVLFHAYQASVGDLSLHAFRDYSPPGVVFSGIDGLLPLFFLLSGFATYYGFGGAVLLGKRLPGSRDFLFKRALRLLPVYFLIFLVVWVWRYGGGASQWLDLIWGLSLFQSWSTEHIFRTIDPGWYLSVEWQFSLVVAFALLPWMRAISNWPMRSRLAGLLAPPLLFIAVTIWWKSSLIARDVPGSQFGSWFAPPSWAYLYGMGMLLGLALLVRRPDRWRLPKPFPTLIVIAGTSWLVWLSSARLGTSLFASQWFFELSFLTPLSWILGALTADPDGWMRRLLRSPVAQLLAAASFSTYLIHAPILRSLNERDIIPMDIPGLWPVSAAALVLVVVPAGLLAFRYVEQPLSGLDRLFQPKLDRELQITKVSTPTLAAGTVLPDVPVTDADGRARSVRQLTGPGGLLLLVHPSDPVPSGHPALQGTRGALRAFDSSQSAAAGFGIRMAALSPRVPDEAESGAPPHPADEPLDDAVVHLQDPRAAIAQGLGLLVVRTAGGQQQPEIALVAIDASGTVVGVARDEDPHRLVRRGLDALADGADPRAGRVPVGVGD
ncbi:acyltransferase [Patulibacter sp.]|uniref:acyltransferase family protein n=1 Tax=Patulibacter sp. TaxID=1912859 RepID=UPI00271EFA66|nr:acyltransferase [Patulibacter sp.]MDO9409183.1 acyltransferase [Patulibacter sp.]